MFRNQFPELAADLERRYGEEHRRYHNFDHVRAMLELLEAIEDRLADPCAVEIAIWYHDAIYDPRSSTNETDSAALLMAELPAEGLQAGDLEAARCLVLATAGHAIPGKLATPQKQDCARFLDMDLAILGAAPAAFDAYDRAIREEYYFVPDELYCAAQRQILEGFLARDRLYFTNDFRGKYEDRARANLARTIDVLGLS